jgi:acyl-CoA thioester hydrolase
MGMGVYTIPITVRFRDLDAMGHVNNSVFFTYFEEGRKEFFFDFYKVTDPSHFEFILAHIGCDFLSPVKLTSKLNLEMWVKDIGKKSFILAYRLVDAADSTIQYAKGDSVQVCYNYKESKSMDVSDELRQMLEKYRILDI